MVVPAKPKRGCRALNVPPWTSFSGNPMQSRDHSSQTRSSSSLLHKQGWGLDLYTIPYLLETKDLQDLTYYGCLKEINQPGIWNKNESISPASSLSNRGCSWHPCRSEWGRHQDVAFLHFILLHPADERKRYQQTEVWWETKGGEKKLKKNCWKIEGETRSAIRSNRERKLYAHVKMTLFLQYSLLRIGFYEPSLL